MAPGEVGVDLVADCLQLTLVALGHADAAPALSGANERGIHQLLDTRPPKASGMTLVPTLLAEQSLE